MDNFNDYISKYDTSIKYMSNQTYDSGVGANSVIFSFGYSDITSDVCFARLYKIMIDRTFSSNYFLRLPYPKNDTDEELHTFCIDYNNFFLELQKLVFDTYEIKLYKTPYKNVKLLTMVDKIEMPYNLHYCLTLIIYTILRGIEGEYNPTLKNNFMRKPLSGDLKEYLYSLSLISRGSHHNINDVLDSVIKIDMPDVRKKTIFNHYVNILQETFGKDGLIHHPNYIKYFNEFFKEKPGGYGYAMQTQCFNYINMTTNKIIQESAE